MKYNPTGEFVYAGASKTDIFVKRNVSIIALTLAVVFLWAGVATEHFYPSTSTPAVSNAAPAVTTKSAVVPGCMSFSYDKSWASRDTSPVFSPLTTDLSFAPGGTALVEAYCPTQSAVDYANGLSSTLSTGYLDSGYFPVGSRYAELLVQRSAVLNTLSSWIVLSGNDGGACVLKYTASASDLPTYGQGVIDAAQSVNCNK